jgi:DNA-binding transcriptional ArsR family regulator
MIDMGKQAKQVASVLRLISNENRLLILCGLIKGRMSVGEISKTVPKIGQSALSQNLAALKAHGVLDSEKIGQQVFYSIVDKRVIKIMEALYECYCPKNKDKSIKSKLGGTYLG